MGNLMNTPTRRHSSTKDCHILVNEAHSDQDASSRQSQLSRQPSRQKSGTDVELHPVSANTSNVASTLRNFFHPTKERATSKCTSTSCHEQKSGPSRLRALTGLSIFSRGIHSSKHADPNRDVTGGSDCCDKGVTSTLLVDKPKRPSLSETNLMERRERGDKCNIPRPKSDTFDRRVMPLVAIDLKNEDGEQEQVEIDEVDEELLKEQADRAPAAFPQYNRCRRQSITDRLQKRRSSEIAADIIRLSAQNRKREFCELLDEHAKLVEEIMRSEAAVDCEKENHVTSSTSVDKMPKS